MKGLMRFICNRFSTMERKIIKNITAIGCIAAFSFALLWRVFHGFDWSDDSYYSAIVYRLILGDSLFQDCWDIHQLSALIPFPVFWIYIKIFGTTGIILFSRIIYVLFISGEAFGLYWKFNKEHGWLWSILAAVLLLGFESNFGLSYNSMMIELFIMAFLVLPTNGSSRYQYMRLFFSGVFTGLAIQAYPSALMVLSCFILFILSNGKDRRWSNIAYYLSGGAFVLLGFIVFLSLNSTLQALEGNVHYLFMDPEHGEFHFSIHEHFTELRELIGNRDLFILFISVVVAAAAIITKGKLRTVLRIAAIVGVIVFLFMQWSSVRTDYGKSSIQYRLFFSIALSFPVLWLLNNCGWSPLVLLFFGGVLGSVGVNFATNNGASFYIYPYLVSAIAALLYTGRMITEAREKNAQISILSAIPAALIASLVVFSFCSSVSYVYRDGELGTLNTNLRSGPASGIYTTQERAAKYEQTVDAIFTYMPKEGQVLFTKMLPFGYLCTSATPATPRMWRTNLDYPLFGEYYQNNPEKKPSAIYLVNENYGITNSGIIISEYMQKLIDSSANETIELECGTIILLEEN